MSDSPRKLPQSRHFLRAARYGIEELVKREPMDEGFMFFVVGILASLRAVQHALLTADSTLSQTHKAVIQQWKKDAPMDGAEISFIKSSRDLLLKGGALNAYAGFRVGGFGEVGNFVQTRKSYEIGYYASDGERRDLLADMRAAANWCDQELTALEAKVPRIIFPGDPA